MRPQESFLNQPIRSLQTMLRVIAEDNKHIKTVVPDGIYGQTTLGAVTEFQKISGLPLTGITDHTTWEYIVKAYEAALIRIGPAEPIEIIIDPGQVFVSGDEGAIIYLLQTILIWLSQDYNAISKPDHTGVLDAATQKSLSEFQTIAGLKPTGELDRITWKHLSKQFTLNMHHNNKRNIIQNAE